MMKSTSISAAVMALSISGVAQNAAAVALDEVLSASGRLAYASYTDSLTTAIALKKAVANLVNNPSEATHQAAKQAWLDSREPYGQTEIYRFQEGPIDDDLSTAEPEDGPEGQINAWPLAEGMIDYVDSTLLYVQAGGDAITTSMPQYASDNANMVADRDFVITKQNIADLNEAMDDGANVTTGYHAIEFLLWGQDTNAKDAVKRDATGGHRSYTDYLTGSGCTNGNCDRRGAYLMAVTDLLVDDLASVSAQWDPAIGSHYTNFVAGSEDSLQKLLNAMGQLSYGELASERIKIALMSDSQEDEHSCFSDNTHRDIVLNAQGVKNIFLSAYNGSSYGAGIYDYMKAKGHGSLADDLAKALESTMNATAVIDRKAKGGKPFDNQIQGTATDKADIQAVVAGLVNQTNIVAQAIDALGYNPDVKDSEVTYASDDALLGDKVAE